MSTPRGKFIVFEGPDRAGKSTLLNIVSGRLKWAEIPHACVRLPSARNAVGSACNAMLRGTTPAPRKVRPLLFLTDMVWICQEELEPTLAAGKHVLCDRYTLSTWVYQMDIWAEPALRDVLGVLSGSLLAPDVLFFVDAPDALLDARLEIETEQHVLHNKVEQQCRYRSRYRHFVEHGVAHGMAHPVNRILGIPAEVIDGSKTSAEMADTVMGILSLNL